MENILFFLGMSYGLQANNGGYRIEHWFAMFQHWTLNYKATHLKSELQGSNFAQWINDKVTQLCSELQGSNFEQWL